MKKIKYIIYSLTALVLFSAIMVSCKRTEVNEVLDGGHTIVKIADGGVSDTSKGSIAVKAYNVDFVSTPATLNFLTVNRDAANNAELQKSLTVVLKDDTTALNQYNRFNGTNLVYLPASFYTVGNGVVKNGGKGGTYTVTFAPGEFAKKIPITIPNATLLDASTVYALAFTIVSSSDPSVTISGNKTIVVSVGAKNPYDGRYSDEFKNYHPSSNPGYTGATVEVLMITTGANTVKIYSNDIGGFYNPSILGGNLTAFGGQEPAYTIDPVTNKVTVQNVAANASTFYTMNPNYDSHYDPATRTIYAKFGYSYVGGDFALGVSREWTQVLKYLGPR